MQLLPGLPAKSVMKRAIVSSPTDAWGWIVASSARKKPTDLSSPVIFSAGKDPTRVPRGKEGRDLITMIHSFALAQAVRTCTPWMGVWKAAKDIGGSRTAYGKAATVLKYLPTTQGNTEYGLFLCLFEQQLVHTRNNVIVH